VDNFSITLGMIVRNEGRTLRRCLESVAPFVDEIVIGLGGESTDDTEQIAREFTDKIFPIEWTNDFSEARNLVLDRATGDYFLWLDGDDELVGGENIRQLLRSHPNLDSFYMGYDYARDENDNCICYLVRERVVRLQDELEFKGWRWVGKVHETLVPLNFDAAKSKLVDNIFVRHHKPPDKHEIDRNLNILYDQLAEQEPNPDPRILGYLCTENAGRGNLKEAILHGQRFVKLSGWREERYQMMHRIADMYRVSGEFSKAIDTDNLAIQICPEWPDAWYGLAETYSAMGNYRAVIEMTKAGATKPAPDTMLIVNPLDYTLFPLVVLAGAYAHLGDYEMSLANYSKAYEIRPDDTIGEQINLLRNEIYLQRVVDAFLLVREQLGRNDEWVKARKLYDALPKHIEDHPKIKETRERTLFQTSHLFDPKAMADFYTGNPHWTPMAEEAINDPAWVNFPRLKFAIEVAKRIGAKSIIDWGCSDGFITLPLAKETGVPVKGYDLDPRCIELATLRAKEWGVEARFEVSNVDEIGAWEEERADLALFFEVIEHVVDPALVLADVEKTAKHIAITTPYLSWERGRIPEWDRLEPKGHVRIFDERDLEALIAPRGRIWSLYKVPHFQGTGWLFCDYKPQATYDKKIVIGAMGSPETWNPKVFETGGLGGSETAIIKLAEGFAEQGHLPVVYSNIDAPGYYNGVAYRDTSRYDPEERSDLYIAWRMPEIADWDIHTKRFILWMHDTDCGDRLTKERADRFDHIVVLSEWHRNYMLKFYPFLDPNKLVIIPNGIDFSRFDKAVKRDPLRVIYSSSQDRGLDIILESIWPKVIEAIPEAELHLYYGWNNIDKFTPMYPHLADFKKRVLEAQANTAGVVQHGRVNQKELAEAFQKSSVWLYPTYFTETYCITAIEAQLGGAIPVTNHLAALKETVSSGIILSEDVRNPEVQELYAKAVIQILSTPLKERAHLHKKVKLNTPAISWIGVASTWSRLFLGKSDARD